MLDYIRGKLTFISPSKVVVETTGLGYGLMISLGTFSKLPKLHENVLLYVATVYREDSQTSYGFLTEEERSFFYLLNDVSGIGPKTAMAVLSHLEIEHLHLAILEKNEGIVSKVPGIGKKTAQRLILELADKCQKLKKPAATAKVQESSLQEEAIQALMYLGYSRKDAEISINKIFNTHDSASTFSLSKLITLSLKK